jgi:hypothetical protein
VGGGWEALMNADEMRRLVSGMPELVWRKFLGRIVDTADEEERLLAAAVLADGWPGATVPVGSNKREQERAS